MTDNPPKTDVSDPFERSEQTASSMEERVLEAFAGLTQCRDRLHNPVKNLKEQANR